MTSIALRRAAKTVYILQLHSQIEVTDRFSFADRTTQCLLSKSGWFLGLSRVPRGFVWEVTKNLENLCRFAVLAVQ